MLPREIAPAFRPVPSRIARVRSTRFSPQRRDPRRFGQARFWLDESATVTESEPSGDLRLFAHSFAGFFLFFSLLIL